MSVFFHQRVTNISLIVFSFFSNVFSVFSVWHKLTTALRAQDDPRKAKEIYTYLFIVWKISWIHDFIIFTDEIISQTFWSNYFLDVFLLSFSRHLIFVNKHIYFCRSPVGCRFSRPTCTSRPTAWPSCGPLSGPPSSSSTAPASERPSARRASTRQSFFSVWSLVHSGRRRKSV